MVKYLKAKMKPLSKETLQRAASKLFFKIDDSEIEVLLKEFDVINKQINILSSLPNVDNVEPMTFPFEIENSFMREDEIEKPLKQEEVLKNAKEVEDGQIILPKVVR